MEKKQKKPRVSVIIPTYNRGWIIKEAIDSVLAQDFKDFELIVVDDGSIDNTLEILNSIQCDIKVLRQSNHGVSAARNRGIAAASGPFIAFLDSDDLWLPQKLAHQVDFFNSNPDAYICQTEEIWVRNNVRVNPKKRHKKPWGMIFEPSLALCLVSPSAVMIRACEDYDLWLRISCRYPVYLIETPLIIKRGGHNDQLSASPGLDKFRIKSLTKIIESGLLSKTQYGAAVKTLKQKCMIYAAGCRKRGREDEAVYYMSLSDRC
ncbi:MAG: glycosyltransferase family 2 protein [Deltaproteobacteria bacterium]|nr:glycosyltransferase family 2 protein [Deltaproteobacteria bacterium]